MGFWVLLGWGGSRRGGSKSLLECFLLSGLLGRMGGGWVGCGKKAGLQVSSLHVSFLGSWVGWVGRGQEAGLLLGFLHIAFLAGWVGWVGRGQEAGLPLGSLHVFFFLGSWVGWAGRGQEAGLALGSLHVAFLGSWVGWVGRGQEAGLALGPSYCLSSSLHVPSFWVLGRMVGPPAWAAAKKLGSRWAPFMFPSFWAPGSDGWARGQEAGLALGSFHIAFLGSWVDRGTEAGFHCVPFVFPFWAPGSDGYAAAKKLGSRCAPFMFPLSGLLGGMGGPRPKSWARIGLPSYCLSGLRWVGRGKEAGLALGSLHISFLGSWVGWVGRCQKAGLCMGWVGRARLGLPHIVLSRMGGPRPRNWASVGLPSCFLISGSWVGWVGRWHRPLPRSWAPVGLPSCFLLSGLLGRMGGPPPNKLGSALGSFHIAFLGFWVGWVGRGQEAGLPLGSLHVSLWVLGRMGGPQQRSWARIVFLGSWVGWVVRGKKLGSLSLCSLLSGLLGRMGGPRPTSWARIGLPSSFLGSWADGWAAAKSWSRVGWVGRGREAGLALGSFHIAFLGSWVGWVGRGKEAGLPLGSLYISFLGSWFRWMGRGHSRWAPFMFPSFWAPGSDGWAALGSLHPFWAPGMMGGPRPRAGLPLCFLSGVLSRMGGPRG